MFTPLAGPSARKPVVRQALRVALAAFAFIGFGLGGAMLSWVVLPLASCDWNRVRRQKRRTAA